MLLSDILGQTELTLSPDGRLTYFLPSEPIRRPRAQSEGSQYQDNRSTPKCDCWECRDCPLVQRSYLRPSSTPILKLPDELIDNIISFAAPPSDNGGFGRHFYRERQNLCLVNRRLHRLALPFLYSVINLGSSGGAAPPGERAIKLYRTLRRLPHLGAWCKELNLFFNESSEQELAEKNYRILRDLTVWMPNVRCLRVRGCAGQVHAIATIRYLISCMPVVEEFQLNRYHLTFWSLDEIRDLLTFKHLRKLRLSGINKTKHLRQDPSQPDTALPEILSYDEQTLTVSPELSSVSLSDFGQSPSALTKFLTFPNHLTHFDLCGLHWAWNQHYWDLGSITNALRRHSSTLVSIQIGCLYRAKGPTNRLNVIEWPALESLQLSKTCIDFTAADAANTLLAPKLENFSVAYSPEDQHSEGWSEMNEQEAEWYLDFTLLAIRRKKRLRNIHIEFNPEGFYIDEPIPAEQIQRWPWEWLDEVCETIREECPEMRLDYSSPCISKERYYEMCRTGLDADYGENDVESNDIVWEDWDEEVGYRGFGPWNREETLQMERFEQYFSWEGNAMR